MIFLDEKLYYALTEEVAIENFENSSLLFLSGQRRVVEINLTAIHILRILNGSRNLRSVIKQTAKDFKISDSEAKKDVLRLINRLFAQGVIKVKKSIQQKNGEKMINQSSFLANPDVSLREEIDGAILFDNERHAVLILNPIGLAIWRFIQSRPRTKKEIVSHLKNIYEDAPKNQVNNDVKDFLSNLQSKNLVKDVINNE